MRVHSFRKALLGTVLGASVFAVSSAPALSADLTVGLAEVNQFLDPHSGTSPAAFNVNSQIFEQLFRWDAEAIPQPWLAERLERLDDLTWNLHLRKDVKWSDGTPFTAEDVKFSLTRGVNVPNATASFKTYMRQIEATDVVDAHTLRIKTNEPAPMLVDALTYFLIISKKHGEKASTEDYNNGKAVIGTGPYKLVSWTNGDSTVLERNPTFWGPRPPWDKITYKAIPSGPARVAALLSGGVQVIEHVPSEDIERLRKNQDTRVWTKLTGRVTYFVMDVNKALETGKVTGINGEKLDKNPFADKRVRTAMREAIDVDAFVKRLYSGEAEATAQYILEGFEGHDPRITFQKTGGVERAKKLLEEAGWHNKFRIELSTATDFFPKSVQTTEAIAQSWTRAGIPTTVQTTPYAVYLKMRNDRQLPIAFSAYQNTLKNASGFYPTLLHTRDAAKGQGTLNFSGYSNPEFDKRVDEAMITFDKEKRGRLFAEATKIALDDQTFTPLFFLYAIHGSNKDVRIEMRADRGLRGDNIFPASAASASQKKN